MKKASLLRPNNLITIISIIIIVITALFGIFFTNVVSALTYQNNVNIGFTFTPTVTVSLSGNSGTDLVIDNLAPGNAADSNIITVTAGTNSGTGFNLTASAGSTDSSSAYYNSNALQNGSSTISSLTSTAANLDAITAGQWGYSYSVDSGTNWVSGNTGSTSTGYAGLPAVNGTAVTLASSNSNASSSVQFKIAAKADTNQVSGTYSNVVNFIATAKPITTNYTITYYDGDTAMSTPVPVVGTISSGNTANVILNSDATKSGYTLKGWCYGALVSDTCNGTIYQPGDTYVVSNIGGTVTINLAAMWELNANDLSLAITFAGTGVDSVKVCSVSGDCTGTDLKGTVSTSGNSVSGLAYGTAYYLYPSFTSGYALDSWAKTDSVVGASLSSTSDANPTYTMGEGNGAVTITGKSSCESTISGTMQAFDPTKLCSGVNSGTLTDSRDTQSYTVAKLADGKWWMTKNLNLAGGTTISCDTSDCNNYTIPTTQGWQSGGKLPASSTSGFDTDNYAYVYNSNSTTCGNNSPCYSYYSWDAATLGSGRSISTDNQNAPYSICPKGWRLPTTYNGSGIAAEATDFRALMIAFGGSNSVQDYNSSTSPTGATMSTTLQSTPNNFLLAGYYLYGSFYNGGSSGRYWSATSSSSSTSARRLYFDSSNVLSASNSNRLNGFGVRCVYGG